ncbi:DUF4190 domain-containing protein [Clostridium sp.]|uniref:DUF4190 domain-containing protein n=1 Tax=Clostridium sp. TaxID=1506 RepID=UPI002FDD77E0
MERVEETKNKIGIISFVLGIIGLIVCGVPIIGALVTIAGLVLGIKGRSTIRKKLSTVGISLCILGLFAVVIDGALSYRGTTATLFNCGANTSDSNVFNIEKENNEATEKIVFCQYIDNNLNTTNIGDTFSVDSQFYAKFDNKAPVETSKLKLTIYMMNSNYFNVFYTEELDIEQDAAALAIPLKIDTAGKYKVIITRLSDNKKLGENEVTAVFYN